MADITQTLLLAEADQVDSNPYITASINPTANRLVLCLVDVADQGFSEPIVVNTVTGAGLTWVKIGQVQLDTIAGPRQSMAVFRALGPSPSAGALTITMDRTAGLGHWIITEFDNIDIGGANGADAIVQFATNVSDSLATIAATLSPFGNVNNATVGCFASGADPATTWTQGSGFTLIAQATGEERVPMMQFQSNNEVNVEATQGVTDDCGAIGIELKNAVPFIATSIITANLLLADGDDTALTVYTTASISPSANKLVLCCVMCADNGFSSAILTSTVTGAGLTWVQVNQIGFDTTVSERRGFAIFRALGPSPSAGALTITLDGPAALCQWTIVEFDNCDTGGTNGSNAIVQFANSRSDTGTDISATLSAFGDTRNATFTYCGSGSVSTTLIEGAGFTKIGEVDLGTIKVMGQFKKSNDTLPAFTQGVNGDMAIIAVELRAEIVTQALLTNDESETDNTVYTTASITPTVDNLILLGALSVRSTSEPPVPTVTGNALTWVPVINTAFNTALSEPAKIALFRAMGSTPVLITQSLLLATRDDANLTVYTTASISPSANKLILCLVTTADDGFTAPILVNSITGAGLTWVEVAEVQYDTIASPRVTLAVYRALGPSPSPGALTITMDGPASEASWIIAEFGNVDTSGTNGSGAVVQNDTDRSDSDTSITSNLAAFGNTANATVGCFSVTGANTWTEGTGFTEISELSGDQSSQMQFRNDNDTTVDATISGSASPIGGIGLEIKNETQAITPGVVTITYSSTQLRAAWAISEFGNVKTTGDDGEDAVRQAVVKAKDF